MVDLFQARKRLSRQWTATASASWRASVRSARSWRRRQARGRNFIPSMGRSRRQRPRSSSAPPSTAPRSRSAGGRGKRGGLSEYARQVGGNRQYLGELVAAAEVMKVAGQPACLSDKAAHLTAIHAAERALWPVLVEALIAKSWSVAGTEHWVGRVAEFQIPEPWQREDRQSAPGKAGLRKLRQLAQLAKKLPVICSTLAVGPSSAPAKCSIAELQPDALGGGEVLAEHRLAPVRQIG